MAAAAAVGVKFRARNALLLLYPHMVLDRQSEPLPRTASGLAGGMFMAALTSDWLTGTNTVREAVYGGETAASLPAISDLFWGTGSKV
jgi:hypothetical protein